MARRGELEGYETVTLRSEAADLEATFVPGAGMVGCSLRHAGEELLELRDGLRAYAEGGATMGIPLLHPWANRLAGFEYSVGGEHVELERGSPLLSLDPNGLPIHGLLAGSPHWRVQSASAGGESGPLIAELDFGAHDELVAAFPFPHVIRMEVKLAGSTLTIATSVVPTTDTPVPISFGYHPYLRLPGAPRKRWEVDLPVRRRLVLDERMIPTGKSEPVSFERAPLGDRTFDDGYAELEPGRPFVAAAAGRELAVSFEAGYPFAQVYAPPGGEFICFEPMTAPTNALATGGDELPLARPGEAFTAVFAISVAESYR
jgi:galactose mutarotase-like enzyme